MTISSQIVNQIADTHIAQAITHLQCALQLWRVDLDEGTAADSAAWSDLHDITLMLAKFRDAEGPALSA